MDERDSLYRYLLGESDTRPLPIPQLQSAPTTSGGLMDYFNADNFGGTLKGIGGIASGLYGMYLGNQQLGIMEDNLAMNKDKWKEQKKELNHLRGTRTRLTNQYAR